MKDIKRELEKIRSFTVEADAVTGEWFMDTYKEVGIISREDHYARRDTDDVAYYTFEKPDERGAGSETCAIEIHWVREKPE